MDFEHYRFAFVCVGIFICLDIVTGLLKGAKAKQLSSAKMRDGLYHKMGFIGMVCLAVAIEFAQSGLELGFTVPLVSPACVYVCVTEVVSVSENVQSLNPELGGFVSRYLAKKED